MVGKALLTGNLTTLTLSIKFMKKTLLLDSNGALRKALEEEYGPETEGWLTVTEDIALTLAALWEHNFELAVLGLAAPFFQNQQDELHGHRLAKLVSKKFPDLSVILVYNKEIFEEVESTRRLDLSGSSVQLTPADEFLSHISERM